MADIKQFWKPLLVLLEHMREAGFIRPGLEVRYLVAEKIEDSVPMLLKALSRAGEPALSDGELVARF
jgi:predicted Rossmann-fold nucleotide-binding protein